MPLDTRHAPLVDQFGRIVTYLRLSVTDRCDLRCRYCMPEKMNFLPRKEVLDLEELASLAERFIDHGVRKIRLTGGEPLVRKGVMTLIEQLSRRLDQGDLQELTLTTNGTLLSRYAADLAALGVRRVNVSLDTLDAERYRHITRFGDISKVMAGLDAAQEAGLKVKINALASKGAFEEELQDLILFAHGRNMDLTLIEEMPLGETSHGMEKKYLSLAKLREDLESRWTFESVDHRTMGPAKFVRLRETGGILGFITPMSCSFCDACNRVRLSCTGKLYTCMGQQGETDLRPILNSSPAKAFESLQKAIWNKPQRHDFLSLKTSEKTVGRHMSVLGG